MPPEQLGVNSLAQRRDWVLDPKPGVCAPAPPLSGCVVLHVLRPGFSFKGS